MDDPRLFWPVRLSRSTPTSRSASGNGMPLSSAPYTMLNIVVVSPMPRVSASTATAESARLFLSERAA